MLAGAAVAQDAAPAPDPRGEPPVRAPFSGLDTLCADDWWNRGPSPIPGWLVTFECWPRDVDVTRPDGSQFPGWPITVDPASPVPVAR